VGEAGGSIKQKTAYDDRRRAAAAPVVFIEKVENNPARLKKRAGLFSLRLS
jgi:hypothetical protein